MSTVRAIITDSLQNLTVTPVGQDPGPEEAAKALTSLNKMAHGLKAEGANLGWGDVQLDDDIPVQPEYEQALTDLLMRHLAMAFQVALSANQAEAASKGLRTLQAAFATIPEMDGEPALRNRLRGDGTERF